MFQWLSSFLMNPILALGGLAVASPILIHLFSRRRFQRIQWAAMSFLLEARKQNRRRIRLQQIILLALRCLAVLLIAFAVARPFVRASSLGGLLAGAGRTEHFVLLDDSYSMGYRAADGRTVFAEAVRAVRQLARRLAADAPSDSLTLYLTSQPRQPKMAVASLAPAELRRIEDLLDTLIQPSQLAARFDDAVAALCATLRQSPTQAGSAIHLVSDFQRRDWSPRDKNASPLAAEPLIALCDARPDARLTLVDVSADAPANLAITDIRTPHARVAADVPARVEIEITNYSSAAREQVLLALELADRVLPPLVIPRLEAGQSLRETAEVSFPVVGPNYLRVRLAGDAASRDGLSIDNTRAVAVEVLPALRVLLVNGAPDSDPFRDEAYLLRTALSPAGRAASGLDVATVTTTELDAVEWDVYSAIILANVGRLSLDARKSLERFVEFGGGLVIFAGNLVDPDEYNRELFRDGRGLLPAALKEVRSAPAGGEPFQIGTWETSHPLMRHFTGALATLLRQVRVSDFIAVQEEGTDNNGNTTTRPAGPKIIARYGDTAGSAAILESSYGRGRVVLLTTSADQDWNNWASGLSYVPMMLELVSYVAHPGDLAGPFVVGEAILCRRDAARVRAQARLRPPDYPVEPEILLTAAPLEAGRYLFAHDAIPRAGIWSLEAVSTQGAPERSYLPVNPDASESDLTPAGRSVLESVFAPARAVYLRNVESSIADAGSSRRELWWPMLLLTAVVLMTEQALAWYFGTKG